MREFQIINKSKVLFGLGIVLIGACSYAQKVDNGKPDPTLAEANDFVADGNEQVEQKQFAVAEASYRKAVAKDPANLSAKYNMGNNYYRNKKYAEGMDRYLQAAEVAQTKEERHKAFHNLGNAYYQQKDFKKAVEAYKNALRNDPTDEETRYNLALAKKEEDKNGGGGNDDDQNKDQNQDQNKDNKDKEGDQGKDKESDDGKPKESDDKGDEKKEDGDQKKDDKGKPDDKKGDNKDDGKPQDQKDQQQQQPAEGQLSPQQVKSLLEAMKNEENKVQDKINAQKVKGAKVKTEKDW